jgi:acyl-CoA-binding protein
VSPAEAGGFAEIEARFEAEVWDYLKGKQE